MPKSNAYMLPADVQPLSYQLTLEPDLQDFTFQGDEAIEIEVLEPTSAITLNCTEIELYSCQLVLSDGSTLTPQDTEMNEDDETASFKFGSTIPAGSARLNIQFKGELNDKLRGFYRSRYTDTEGNQQIMASTQFEATDARRAFPCWDEPSLKAKFGVTLVVPSDMVAVSNMPAEQENDVGNGKKAVRFAETPVMSTYLLAFAVGDFSCIEKRADSGTLIRVWTTTGREEQGRFALDTSARLLGYFNGYFGIPFPLPKLDHIAIPDFAAGAMENWGAITYRETALLVDPQHSSAGTRQTVASIIAHEMAHMWFGDLVTMAWWNDLWLNESFASWMGDKATDYLFPDWEIWTQFVTGDTNRGLNLDGLKNSHPIEQEVKNPAEIGELFDAISYSKGASVLRMLEDFLGEETFRQGLHQYLKDHEYANARTEHLWQALAAASGQPVEAIMDTWVKQTGYPVLDAQVERGSHEIVVSLSQQRFLYDTILGDQQADGTMWRVPVRLRSASMQDPASLLMQSESASTSLKPGPSGSTDEWVKVNTFQTGFYRVKYAHEELERLAEPVQDLSLPPADRLGIQNDAFALSRAGHVPATRFLSIAQAYKNETSASVCSDLADNLDSLDNLIKDESFHPQYMDYVRSIFKLIGERIGWDAKPSEGHLDALLRSTVLLHLGDYGDQNTLSEASNRFARFVEDPANVHPDIRGVTFALAARNGDRSVYDTMWDLHQRAALQEEKVRLLIALSRFDNNDLLQETLNRSLSDRVRAHETITVVLSVASNRNGRDMAWRFVKDNWEEFDRRYGDGGFALMRLVSLTAGFTTNEMHDDVERFFKDHPAPGAHRSIRQALEKIRHNAAWVSKNRDDLAAWFSS